MAARRSTAAISWSSPQKPTKLNPSGAIAVAKSFFLSPLALAPSPQEERGKEQRTFGNPYDHQLFRKSWGVSRQTKKPPAQGTGGGNNLILAE
jgi:hypothetical protein